MKKTGMMLLAAMSFFTSALAQTPAIDTVTIIAPRPNASEAGPQSGLFEIRRSGPTNFGLLVFFQVSGTASNGVDFDTLPTTVSIPQGSLTATLTVNPIDDNLVEGPETVHLQIVGSPLLCPSPACGYIIGWPSNATVTIADNDPLPVPDGAVNIYATDPVATEPNPLTANAPDTATFTVRRSGGTNESIAVFYQISGTAANGVDYQALSGQVSIPEGAWSADIMVVPLDDSLVEGTETVVLTLLAPCPQCLFANPPCEVPQGTNCYPIGSDNSAVAYIRDRNTTATNPPVVSILSTDPVAVEGPFCWSNWWWTTSGTVDGWKTNGFDWRTNHCSGSNTATFVVRRSDDTNSDLTVYFAVGGTASNGIDYVTLPGQATIPAGRYAAPIAVLPLDDHLREPVETILLVLQPPPSTSNGVSTTYVIGSPSRAAAVILDNDQPRPPSCRLNDGMFHLCAPGTNGYSFCIRASADLATWTALCTNIVTDGAIHFVDPDSTGSGKRFYRVVPEPNYSPPQ